MTRLYFISLIALAVFWSACSNAVKSKPAGISCKCDTLKAKEIITAKDFNRIPQFDTIAISSSDFYSLSEDTNRLLWYRDIENVDTTRFTPMWNDYAPFNYHASHEDFIKYYNGKTNIELAFQFGPGGPLWAYHTFVIKNIGCCYLVTRSNFRHARFVYKAYSIMDGSKLDSLYSILSRINTRPASDSVSHGYLGYFADNRNKRSFFIDFENEVEKAKSDTAWPQPKKEISELYEFVDKTINWRVTYSL
jgi:hypothetical protein